MLTSKKKKILNGITGMRTGMELEHEQLIKGMVTRC